MGSARARIVGPTKFESGSGSGSDFLFSFRTDLDLGLGLGLSFKGIGNTPKLVNHLKSKHVLAERGEYASAYGAELRSVFLRLPQYDRLAALGHNNYLLTTLVFLVYYDYLSPGKF